MPIWSILMLIAVLFNIAIPLSGNWLGEYLSLVGLYSSNPLIAIIASSGIILSALYSIWLYVRMVGGTSSPYLTYTWDVSRREYWVLMYLLMPCLVFGIYSEPITRPLSVVVGNLVS